MAITEYLSPFWVAALGATAAVAENWVRPRFSESLTTLHGRPRGGHGTSVLVHQLIPYEVHVRSVRTSCGCTTPRWCTRRSAARERGHSGRLHTRSFTGQRGATITVVFDRPYYVEAQLQVRGFIRSDVVFTPAVSISARFAKASVPSALSTSSTPAAAIGR